MKRRKQDTLLKIVEGKRDLARAFTMYEVSVEGDPGKALLLKKWWTEENVAG